MVNVWDKEQVKKSARNRLSPKQKQRAKARAEANNRPYPNLVDNMWAARFVKEDITEEENKNKPLEKPFRTPGEKKKFAVYVRNDKGNVIKVRYGDPNLSIKRDNPGNRKRFRARHNCDNPGPKVKARFWSCRNWRAGAKVGI